MLYFGLAAFISYGLAYFICSTGLQYWRSVVGILSGFIVGFFGSTALVTLIATKLGGSLAMQALGQVAILSLLLSVYGAYRARFQLKTGKPALPFKIPNWVSYVAGAVFLVGVVAAIAIPASQNMVKFDSSTAALAVEAPQIEKSTNLKPFNGKLDAEPVNPYGQHQEKPNESSSNASQPFSYEDAKYEEAIGLLKQSDYANALKILNPLATQGHSDSQWSLAWLYTNGQGVVQDVVEASKWFRLAAQQGHAGAQAGLGMAYADGRGLHRDQIKALMWQSLGALSGNPFMVDGRDRLAQSMTQQQVDQAQQMARECQLQNFKNC